MGNGAKLLRTSEVAARLGVDTGTVARYIREGTLPALATSGGHYRVYESDLDAFFSGRGPQKGDGAVVIAIVNQQGGVGKTTATANLSVLLSQMGLRVLAVDMDPQAHLTRSLGHDPNAIDYTIYSALIDDERTLDVSKAILATKQGPNLAPNNILASDSEEYLRAKPTWGARLSKVLRRLRGQYDYILLDSTPNLGSLTINVLHAADFVLIPTRLEIQSVKGMQLLLRRIDEAREDNPKLQVAGAVCMMVQPSNSSRSTGQASRRMLEEIGIRPFSTVIERSAHFGDAANRGSALATANPRSEQTQAYRQLLAELLRITGGPGVSRLSRLETSDDGEAKTRHSHKQ